MAGRNTLQLQICRNTLPCFARNGDVCTILTETYKKNECPFRKVNRENKAVGGHEYAPDGTYMWRESK